MWRTSENSSLGNCLENQIATSLGLHQGAKGAREAPFAVLYHRKYTIESPFSYFPDSFSKHRLHINQQDCEADATTSFLAETSSSLSAWCLQSRTATVLMQASTQRTNPR